MSVIPTADEIQFVYDLIITRCEHTPHWHKKGAQALRTVNRLADLAKQAEHIDRDSEADAKPCP